MKKEQVNTPIEVVEKTQNRNDVNVPLDYVMTGDIFNDVSTFIKESQAAAFRAVDLALIKRNWLIGKRIFEEELKSPNNDNYRKEIMHSLSKKLVVKYGKGFDQSNLYHYYNFYTKYKNIFDTVCRQSFLSWSHYRKLIYINDDAAREWYEKEAIKEMWSFRTLKRNIDTHYYYRIIGSKKADESKTPNQENEYETNLLEHIKNPSLFEFLNLSRSDDVYENELETALLTNLQKTMMELGKGFAFVGRQFRIQTVDNQYFVDLVFYNYILKCFVLFELKTHKITYEDIGQMDMYVGLFDSLIKGDDDNPTLGILLCSETDEDIARYSFLNGSKNIFATKYLLYMPSNEELKAEIEHQKQVFFETHAKQLKHIKTTKKGK